MPSKKVNPKDKLLTLRNFSNLAEASKEAGKLHEAEELFRTAYYGRVKALGRDHPQSLIALHDLALVLELKRKFAESEDTFKDVLSGRERVLGKHDPSTCCTAFCLADLYHKLNRNDEALRLFEYALEGYTTSLGPDHKNTKIVRKKIKNIKQSNFCAIS